VRRRCLCTGRRHKSQRVTQRVELFGYRRKAPLRALRPKLVLARTSFTRAWPYKKNDQADIEQEHFTHVRQWFGDERSDTPAVWPRILARCRGRTGPL
jgi:hypothetical protein